MTLESQLAAHFNLAGARLEHLDTPTNDIAIVTTPSAKYALKMYNIRSRGLKDVQWELDLIEHLVEQGVSVVQPIRGKHGYVETFTVDGQERAVALFAWLLGDKPKPSQEVYKLLGEAAARIHNAADSFHPSWMRDNYDSHVLIDEQIERMKKHLVEAGQYDRILALGERLKLLLANPSLDQGICHMDLTLDNVHIHDGKLTAFDFDSSGYCWRAYEPYRALLNSKNYFNDWLEGYREVRQFSEADERAVYAFVIIGEIRNVVWNLGEAKSSRGTPSLTAKDLPEIVDEWLVWEREYLK